MKLKLHGATLAQIRMENQKRHGVICGLTKLATRGSVVGMGDDRATFDYLARRLRFAEHVLTLLAAGKLPHVRNFVLRAQLEFRKVADTNTLNAATPSSKLKDASTPTGFVKVHYEDGSPVFTAFYTEPKSSLAAEYHARCFGKLARLTYQAIGLDIPDEDPPTADNAEE